jgi:hypothetical protein
MQSFRVRRTNAIDVLGKIAPFRGLLDQRGVAVGRVAGEAGLSGADLTACGITNEEGPIWIWNCYFCWTAGFPAKDETHF